MHSDAHQNGGRVTWRRIVEQSCYFCFLHAPTYSCSFIKLWFEPLMLCGLFYQTLYCFCALIVVVPLLSMEGQKALGFYQKYILHLCI